MGLEFAKIFVEPDTGRQILAVRRDLRNYGPAVVFTTRMSDGRYLDRIYFSGEGGPEAVAAIDAYFEELNLEIASYQIAKSIAEFSITGHTGDVPGEVEGGQFTTSADAAEGAGNPEEDAE